MNLPELFTFEVRPSIQLKTNGLEGEMGVGNEGGNSILVKFGIGGRV